MAGEHSQRLKWKCRRGLLELDLVLKGFLERGFSVLGQEEKELFERMLDLPDLTLWGYLNGSERPEDPRVRSLIDNIS